ncbi:cx9C motif-containing protein 4-like [Mytilus galloprovincialis]|uniref:cx9C motif-containing protein 4-like n=1 Tax=Mytilus galloprovincialis TaxID=29158 RepID=UPI003F7B5E0E
MSRPDPCQKYACKIQDCLQANNYKMESCKNVIEQLVQCCRKLKDPASSPPCSGYLKHLHKKPT